MVWLYGTGQQGRLQLPLRPCDKCRAIALELQVVYPTENASSALYSTGGHALKYCTRLLFFTPQGQQTYKATYDQLKSFPNVPCS